MYKYLIDDIAQAELDSVGGVYISHFARLGDSAKGRAWANRFYREHLEHIAMLKSDPFRYGSRAPGKQHSVLFSARTGKL